jgi:hypothetical protein
MGYKQWSQIGAHKIQEQKEKVGSVDVAIFVFRYFYSQALVDDKGRHRNRLTIVIMFIIIFAII